VQEELHGSRQQNRTEAAFPQQLNQVHGHHERPMSPSWLQGQAPCVGLRHHEEVVLGRLQKRKAAQKEDPLTVDNKGNMSIEFLEVRDTMLMFGGPKTYESKR
jgi:hypothetical protein